MTAVFSADELAQWCGGQWERPPVRAVRGVGHDTRTLSAGMLYVALRGPQQDGHDFVGAAWSAGAAGGLVERRWLERAAGARERRVPLLVVEDTRRALADLACGYRRRLAPAMIGITGSMGKTTVKDMLADMTARRAPTARTFGNWYNEIGLPLRLLAMPSATRIGVFELGINHPGEMAPLCAILQPERAVVTNIAPAHIEFFENVEAIAEEKAQLLRCLPARGVAVLNRDDACFERLRARTPCPLLTVSFSRPADLQCIAFDGARREAILVEAAQGSRHRLRLSLPGRHQAANAMMAALMARDIGVPWPDILEAARTFASARMRWQETEAGGVRLVNDAYNANPTSMRAAVQAFAESSCEPQTWLALGDMLELGAGAEKAHRALGRWLARGHWQGLILLGEHSRALAEGAAEAGFDAASIFPCDSTVHMAELLHRHVRRGAAVLLKASRGMRLEEAVRHFEERTQAHSNGQG